MSNVQIIWTLDEDKSRQVKEALIKPLKNKNDTVQFDMLIHEVERNKYNV
jgi:hypothetical protein